MEEEPVMRNKPEDSENSSANLRSKSKSVFADRSKLFGGQSKGDRPISSFLGGGNVSMCAACNKRVYPMELMKVNGNNYHKFCFKCNKCKRTLGIGNFTVDVKNNDLYCKPHFMQLFKTKGNYDDGFNEHASHSGDTNGTHENGVTSGGKKAAANGQVTEKTADKLETSKKEEGDKKIPEDDKEADDEPAAEDADTAL